MNQQQKDALHQELEEIEELTTQIKKMGFEASLSVLAEMALERGMSKEEFLREVAVEYKEAEEDLGPISKKPKVFN